MSAPQTVHDVRQKLAYRDRLLAVLIEAGKQRHLRENVVDTPYGPEMGWDGFERQVMLDEVNLIRSERGLLPGDPARVERADRLAAGHVDWAEKFALYCAEHAMERP